MAPRQPIANNQNRFNRLLNTMRKHPIYTAMAVMTIIALLAVSGGIIATPVVALLAVLLNPYLITVGFVVITTPPTRLFFELLSKRLSSDPLHQILLGLATALVLIGLSVAIGVLL